MGTSAQVTSPEVPQGDRAILYCDATDVVNATTSSITFPITIAQGGTNATSAAAALTNLGGASSGITITAGAGLTGGGDLTANRTLDVGAGTGITVNAGNVALDTGDVRNVNHQTVEIEAGSGLTGGGNLLATRTINVGAGSGISVGVDTVFLDTTSSRNADHAAIDIIAGDGLTGGGAITADRTLNLDISGLTAMTVAPVGTDGYLIDDGGVMKRQSINDMRLVVSSDSGTHVFTDDDMNEARQYTGSTSSDAWTMNTGVGEIGQAVLIVNAGTTAGPTITAGTATISSSRGNFVVKQNGLAVLYKATSNNWKLTGDLEA